MSFELEHIRGFRHQTPFFVYDHKVVLHNLKEYKRLMPPRTEICYAMKANSEKGVLETLTKAGASFEVASKYELGFLKDVGTSPKRIIYGTSVKPVEHIKAFVKYGVDRYAFDSRDELHKLAQYAPGAKVFVRVNVDDRADSVFHLSEKFGTNLDTAVELLAEAPTLGLVPYGISFNVGSQARRAEAWGRAVRQIASGMRRLDKRGVRISMINLGGGFPYSYNRGDGFPSLERIAQHLDKALPTLPYPVSFLAEPGRGIVADAFVLVTSIIGKSVRPNGTWLFMDAGVYNAMLESTKMQGSTLYQVEPLTLKESARAKARYILTGPTGDNIDVIHQEAALPASIQPGDRLLIHDVGAYTFPLITRFNGFPKPRVIEE